MKHCCKLFKEEDRIFKTDQNPLRAVGTLNVK